MEKHTHIADRAESQAGTTRRDGSQPPPSHLALNPGFPSGRFFPMVLLGALIAAVSILYFQLLSKSTLAEDSHLLLQQHDGPRAQHPTPNLLPPNFDEWFQFAQENECLIDEYDQIHRDFAPFHQLAAEDPAHFMRMVDFGRALIDNYTGVATIQIKSGMVVLPGTNLDKQWAEVIGKFAHILPDMDILINTRAVPRVAFNWDNIQMRRGARKLRDAQPFRNAPVSTLNLLKEKIACNFVNSQGDPSFSAIEDVALIRLGSSSDFTMDLWPILSTTKISPCFSDILVPNPQDHYKGSLPSNANSGPSWAEKKQQLYWRGASDGGHIIGTNYHQFPRFRLVDIARNHPDIINAKIDALDEAACTFECDRMTILQEYDIAGVTSPPDELHQYKYLLDIDGNTTSERYLEFLRSGSLVFKSTTFAEYFSGWLQPYRHYIPVKTDLSDLVNKIEWAIENDGEAQRIQQLGLQTAQRVLTEAQNDCYFALVLLEWAGLQNHEKTHVQNDRIVV
ncbi:glycosyl transferase family 90-domain-containing protein [Mycena crocata]|nr:glycosyl transferase family 90-domain-containing protein [Mycena crocata]